MKDIERAHLFCCLTVLSLSKTLDFIRFHQRVETHSVLYVLDVFAAKHDPSEHSSAYLLHFLNYVVLTPFFFDGKSFLVEEL